MEFPYTDDLLFQNKQSLQAENVNPYLQQNVHALNRQCRSLNHVHIIRINFLILGECSCL